MDPHLRRRSLIELLSRSASPIAVADLAERFEVSARTVHYDLAELKRAGQNVVSVMGRGGGFWIRPQGANSRPGDRPAVSGPGISEAVLLGRHMKFVGREDELLHLESAAGQAHAGEGSTVLISGEPGIGKTRLVRQIAERLSEQEFRVAWGRCHRDSGAPPFWPWRQALQSVLATLSDRSQSSEDDLLTKGQRLLDRLTPELRRESDHPQPSRVEDPDIVRFRLFTSLAQYLDEVAASMPLALVLEDLHWADEPSVRFLEFLSREMAGKRLLVAGTYRDTDAALPLRASLPEILRAERSEHLPLAALSAGDVRAMVADAPAVQGVDDAAATIARRSGGNPLYATELIRLLALGGPDAAAFHLPEGVKHVIGERVSHLSDRCRRMLAAAAVLEEEFESEVLQQVLGAGAIEEVLGLIDEAVSLRLFDPHETAGRVRFAHVLVRETVLDSIPVSERAQAHLRVAGILQQHYGSASTDHAEEIAFHLAEAQPLSDPELLARFLVVSGDASLDSQDLARARAQFESALAAIEDDRESEHFLPAAHGLSKALMASGPEQESQRGIDLLRELFDFAMEAGDRATAIRLASTRVPNAAAMTGVADLLSRAIPLVEDGSEILGYMLAEFAQHVYYETADAAVANDAADRAIQIAETRGDDHLLAFALTKASSLATHEADLPRCVEMSRRAVEAGRLAGNDYAVAYAGFHFATKGAALGHMDEARQTLDFAIRTAAKVNRWKAMAELGRAYIAMLTGEWELADDFWDVAHDSSGFYSATSQQLAMICYYRGDLVTGRRIVESFMSLADDSPDSMFSVLAGVIGGSMLARFENDHSQIAFARACADRLLTRSNTSALGHEAVSAALGWIAVAEEDEATAERLIDFFEDGHALPIGSIETLNAGHVLARLHCLVGNRDQAKDRFRHTTEFLRTAGYEPELALGLADFGDLLIEQGSARERREAIACFEEARDIAARLEMRPTRQRVAKALADATAPGRARPENPAGLSEREAEVLRLVARGLANSAIAARLSLSRHTVVRHLVNIYAKIGVDNRSEATAFAVRNELA